MSSDSPQYPLPYSSLVSTEKDSDGTDNITTNSTLNGSSPSHPSQLGPNTILHSPQSKHRRGNKTPLSSPRKPNRKNSSTPTPCCTPTNSPEKLRNPHFSPEGSNSRPHSSRGSKISGSHHRLRSPGSPPTPFSASGHREKDREQHYHDRPYSADGSGYRGVSKLNLDLVQAARASERLAAAALSSDGEMSGYGTGIGNPVYYGSLAERQRRYKELNKARIKNWERFYGDMDGTREGGEVRKGGRVLVALRGGIDPEQETEKEEENVQKEGVEEKSGKLALPVKFV